jgi:hypothetical protein
MFVNLVLALAMLAANAKPAPVSLQVKVLEPATRHSLDVPSFGYWSDAQCDADANLYFHINNGDYMNPKFFRMSRNGEDADILGPSGDFSNMEKFAFEGFFVTSAGEPYVLGGDGKKSYVIAFAHDGSMKTPIAIETPSAVVVNGFAVFESGGFLVSGRYSPDTGPVSQRGKSYLAIFDASGILLKELRGLLPDQDPKNAKADANVALDDEAKVASSEDGKLYLLNSDHVLVMSASGEVQKIHFQKPDPKSLPTRVYVSGNLIAIRLSTFSAEQVETQRRFLVLDRDNGYKPFGYYKASEETGDSDVCFTREQGFTFQKFEQTRQTLFVAPLR